MVEYIALDVGLLVVIARCLAPARAKDERKCFHLEGQSDSLEFWLTLTKKDRQVAAELLGKVLGKIPTPQLMGVYSKGLELKEVLAPGSKVLGDLYERASIITSNPFNLSEEEKNILLADLAAKQEARKLLVERLEAEEEAITDKVKFYLNGNPNLQLVDDWVCLVFNDQVIERWTIKGFAKKAAL